ncbi:redox-sensitive transcriptional activator SoxR [Stackebrandtia nassauensis]|uniref:Transcriptional regulator, MerR family n=1 Tax=Stackebrandtia nassauensis (strain DSM 44728 / CIP 108903 / NRRL B-16338 / NBRC 102104 / LLR-40K-21) TaxID=446470 RepID=D3Q491_STANL|nr:transcriptional regulator, MerR family [Stackebrandtia nassauensis DSM 44728]
MKDVTLKFQDHLTVGEFADRAGVSAPTLRFYEKRGLITSERTSGNQRRYSRAELRRVAFIRTAQKVGLSLDEIASALAELPDARTPNKADWQRLSSRWQDRLNAKIRTLENLRDELTNCIGCGCLSLKSCAIANRYDELAAQGPGPRRLLNT